MATDRKFHEALRRAAYEDLHPIEYQRLTTCLNILITNEVAAAMQDVPDQIRQEIGVAVAIGTTGSDGRQEAGSELSPFEAIMVTNQDVDTELLEGVGKRIIEKAVPGRVVNFEAKGPNSQLAAYKGNRKNLQPGRIRNLRIFPGVGNPSLIHEAKKRLGQEMLDINSNTLDDIVGLKRDAAKATRDGKNRIGGKDAIHFDLESGVVYFDPTSNQRSFKIGPLRLVQNTLLVEEIRHTRREKDPNFMSTLHSGIVNLLEQLSDDRMLSVGRDFSRELQEHYAFFLRMYHRSEHAYNSSKTVAIQLSESEKDEVAKRLVALQEILEHVKITKQKLPSSKTTKTA